ncbi:MAG: metallophosphoesterase family protein, partial [Candidatus Omnitrophota bacterium]
GDIVGYGADPCGCIEMVKSLKAVCVLGNHDAAVIGKKDIPGFTSSAAEAVIWTRDNIGKDEYAYLNSLPVVMEHEDFTVAHGTLHDPWEFQYMRSWYDAMSTFSVLKHKICFVGHSHIPGVFSCRGGKISEHSGDTICIEKGARYIINAGSVGQPRDGDPRSCYCAYYPERGVVEFCRVEYDIGAARKSILEKGLPAVLGDRLLNGR